MSVHVGRTSQWYTDDRVWSINVFGTAFFEIKICGRWMGGVWTHGWVWRWTGSNSLGGSNRTYTPTGSDAWSPGTTPNFALLAPIHTPGQPPFNNFVASRSGANVTFQHAGAASCVLNQWYFNEYRAPGWRTLGYQYTGLTPDDNVRLPLAGATKPYDPWAGTDFLTRRAAAPPTFP